MPNYEVADRTERAHSEIRRLSERDGIEPELRERALALHMNVRRLVVFIAEEKEPVGAYAKDGRHSPLTISSSAAKRKERERLTMSPLQ
jgi:hypothetical protein